MKTFKENIRILVFILLISSSIKAQQISVEFSTGLSGILYELNQGDSNIGFGASIGGNYTYTLTENWNIIGGLHLGMHTSEISADALSYKSREVDDTTSGFELTVNSTNYTEQQQLFTLNVPVLAQYSTYLNRFSKFYIAAGGKILVPIQQSSNANATSVSLSGYYPDTNLTVDNLPQHGFGSISNWEDFQTPLELSTAIALSLQVGMDFNLGRKMWYAGLYFDYGLNDIASSDESNNFIKHNSNGINKTKANGIANSGIAKSAKIMSLGINLRLLL